MRRLMDTEQLWQKDQTSQVVMRQGMAEETGIKKENR